MATVEALWASVRHMPRCALDVTTRDKGIGVRAVEYKDVWWASALSRMDTRDSLSNVYTRGVPGRGASIGALTVGLPPEEVTTFNLVRRLVERNVASGGRSVALHSRPLEGGHAPTGRLPSGCDLEIAAEVQPGVWVDLALQAKRFDPLSGTYKGWSPAQNAHMINWASVNGGRTPGMLLYNTDTAPFASPGEETELLGGCCEVTKACHGWKWPGAEGQEWSLPDRRSPMAVCLVLDQSWMSIAHPTPEDLRDVALPLECIFCPNFKGTVKGIPRWAAILLDEEVRAPEDVRESSAVDEGDYREVDPGTGCAYSLVLGRAPRVALRS